MTALQTIESPSGELLATFAPEVGCVCSSLTHRGVEVLAQRNGLEGYAATGSTMGIPLLHPWANRLDARIDSPLVKSDANGLPIHGVLPAALRWDAESDAHSLRATLEWTREELLAVFPHPHRLTLEAVMAGDGLAIATTLEPLGDPVPVSFGYHPYFVAPGVPRAAWEVELPVRRRALLDERGLPNGKTESVDGMAGPLGGRTFDDAYDELSDPPVFALAGGGRRIEVEFREGYEIAQVYAPAGQDLIAFEPMTAPVNALVTGDRLSHATVDRPYRASFEVRCTST